MAEIGANISVVSCSTYHIECAPPHENVMHRTMQTLPLEMIQPREFDRVNLVFGC